MISTPRIQNYPEIYPEIGSPVRKRGGGFSGYKLYSHRIHGTGIFTYIYHKIYINQLNVGKYNSWVIMGLIRFFRKKKTTLVGEKNLQSQRKRLESTTTLGCPTGILGSVVYVYKVGPS